MYEDHSRRSAPTLSTSRSVLRADREVPPRTDGNLGLVGASGVAAHPWLSNRASCSPVLALEKRFQVRGIVPDELALANRMVAKPKLAPQF